MHKETPDNIKVPDNILTENKVSFNVPTELKKQENELQDYMKSHDPVKMVKKITGREWSKSLIIEHKEILGQSADLDEKGSIILLNFKNGLMYCWVSTCHEFAHLILRHGTIWYQDPPD